MENSVIWSLENQVSLFFFSFNSHQDFSRLHGYLLQIQIDFLVSAYPQKHINISSSSSSWGLKYTQLLYKIIYFFYLSLSPAELAYCYAQGVCQMKSTIFTRYSIPVKLPHDDASDDEDPSFGALEVFGSSLSILKHPNLARLMLKNYIEKWFCSPNSLIN